MSMEEYEDGNEYKSYSPLLMVLSVILVIVMAGYLIHKFVWLPRIANEKAKQEIVIDSVKTDKKYEVVDSVVIHHYLIKREVK